ncbi:FAD-dependent oxidoreductase [Patescibacteria group bacterium]|jgi:protoporphyrinogen oxidase|nr:FAD-dependent oxidoreductase [Patescibacteria group bacterium]
MKYALDARVGIVGAGAAGLSAAETLRDRGYTSITILERSERAGGKCHSIQFEGRSYELGAGVISDSSRFVRGLAKKYDVPTKLVDFSARMCVDSETGKPMKRSASEMRQLGAQVLRYYRLSRKYQTLLEPGFANVAPELSVPFANFAKTHRIELLAEEFAKYFTGFGYGFFDEVPAAYVLKYYPWDVVFAYFKQTFFKFPEGIQGLWEAIAKSHQVVYGANIQTIERGEAITVTTEKAAFTFDALIIASPLDEALRYLDASEEERALFRKIRHYDYRTYGCMVKGFPKMTGYVPGNLNSTRLGRPVFWYQRYEDSDLYTFYTFGDWKMSDEDTLRHIRHTVEQLGGVLETLHVAERWKYFPHVSPDDMQDGYFDKLEAMQGENHTYYAGELLNFSTVAHTASYAKKLVERFF